MAYYKGSQQISGLTPVDSSIDKSSNNAISNNAVANALEAIKDEIFDSIYPIGSIYVSLSNDIPTSFKGTWERIADEYYLVSSSTNQGTTLSEQLPNITGCIPSARSGTQFGAFDNVSGLDPNTNPFYSESVASSDYCVGKNYESGNSRIRFDLSRFNKTYTNGGKVQPKSIQCSMWKRTA